MNTTGWIENFVGNIWEEIASNFNIIFECFECLQYKLISPWKVLYSAEVNSPPFRIAQISESDKIFIEIKNL